MLISIFAGVIAFFLTVIGIPAFIRFYHKAQITGQQMLFQRHTLDQSKAASILGAAPWK